MKEFNIFDIGYSYVMNFHIVNQDHYDSLLHEILERKMSAFVISEFEDLPFPDYDITVFLFRCTYRKAYEVFNMYSGKYISPISSECIKAMLSSSLCTLDAIHRPMIYKLVNEKLIT